MKHTGMIVLLVTLTFALFPSAIRGQNGTDIEVSRIVICTEVEEREPLDSSERFDADVGTVYCFTEVRNIGEPSTITHKWYRDDQLVAEVPLSVEGSRFRTWSSKQIPSDATGEWQVEAVDESGDILAQKSFHVGTDE